MQDLPCVVLMCMCTDLKHLFFVSTDIIYSFIRKLIICYTVYKVPVTISNTVL